MENHSFSRFRGSLFGGNIDSFSIGFHGVYSRRPKTLPRRPKTPPRRSQDAPRRPMAAPRRPQDAPKTLPGRPKTPPGAENKGLDLGSKSDFQRNRLQTSILEGLGLDFWRFWDGFWEVLRKIFEDFGVCLGCFGRVSSLVFFFTKQHEAPDTTRGNRTLTTNKRASRSY